MRPSLLLILLTSIAAIEMRAQGFEVSNYIKSIIDLEKPIFGDKALGSNYFKEITLQKPKADWLIVSNPEVMEVPKVFRKIVFSEENEKVKLWVIGKTKVKNLLLIYYIYFLPSKNTYQDEYYYFVGILNGNTIGEKLKIGGSWDNMEYIHSSISTLDKFEYTVITHKVLDQDKFPGLVDRDSTIWRLTANGIFEKVFSETVRGKFDF
jgi:hypothetical protein